MHCKGCLGNFTDEPVQDFNKRTSNQTVGPGELMSQKSNVEAAERLGLLGYGLSDDEATRPGPGRTITARPPGSMMEHLSGEWTSSKRFGSDSIQ